jgi:hypothetical protein
LLASTRKLLDLVEREQVKLVIFGHDGQQWQTLKKAAGILRVMLSNHPQDDSLGVAGADPGSGLGPKDWLRVRLKPVYNLRVMSASDYNTAG